MWQMSHHKLLTIETQVAFVVTDSTQDTDTTHWAALAEEVLYCTVLYCTVLCCTVLVLCCTGAEPRLHHEAACVERGV